jgi:hypothetical protein
MENKPVSGLKRFLRFVIAVVEETNKINKRDTSKEVDEAYEEAMRIKKIYIQ